MTKINFCFSLQWSPRGPSFRRGFYLTKTFSLSEAAAQNKLECLPMKKSNLFKYGQEPTHIVWHIFLLTNIRLGCKKLLRDKHSSVFYSTVPDKVKSSDVDASLTARPTTPTFVNAAAWRPPATFRSAVPVRMSLHRRTTNFRKLTGWHNIKDNKSSRHFLD